MRGAARRRAPTRRCRTSSAISRVELGEPRLQPRARPRDASAASAFARPPSKSGQLTFTLASHDSLPAPPRAERSAGSGARSRRRRPTAIVGRRPASAARCRALGRRHALDRAPAARAAAAVPRATSASTSAGAGRRVERRRRARCASPGAAPTSRARSASATSRAVPRLDAQHPLPRLLRLRGQHVVRRHEAGVELIADVAQVRAHARQRLVDDAHRLVAP